MLFKQNPEPLPPSKALVGQARVCIFDIVNYNLQRVLRERILPEPGAAAIAMACLKSLDVEGFQHMLMLTRRVRLR